MAFLRKLVRNGREYFYLVHTIRNKDKTFKKSIYIGKVKPSKAKIEELKKHMIKEIREKIEYEFLSKEEASKAGKLAAEFFKEFQKMPETARKDHLLNFIIKFTYNSNAIEGSTLSLKDTAGILGEGRSPAGKRIEEIREAENTAKCFEIIRKYKGNLTLDFILKLHKTLLTEVNDEIAGKLRNYNVGIRGSEFTPPDWTRVLFELNEFIAWHKKNRNTLHPIELAALVHLKYVTIHPFGDGNGRTSRLLMNWILYKNKFPMINIKYEKRGEYYNALEKCQVDRQEKSFIDYIYKKFVETYEHRKENVLIGKR